jgi:hypothetical protein
MIGHVPGAALILLATAPCVAAAQVAIHGGVQVARAEHRLSDGNMLVPSSGTLFGGALVVAVGRRWEVQGEARGGRFAAPGSPGLDDHDVAEVHLLGGMKARPWLTVQSGVGVRNFSNALARQHWTIWRIGAEARVPLGFESVQGILRGYWLPVVAVSGLANPQIALATGVGVEWRGPRIGVSALYSLERYDFPSTGGAQRLEELSSLQLRVGLRWPAIGK